MPLARSVPVGRRGRLGGAGAPRAGRGRRGFTLIETALSTIIIGVGVLAVVEAQSSFLQRNSWSTSASTATYLANEVREMTHNFSRHDRFTGGLFFTDPADPSTLTGWGRETGEAAAKDLNDVDDLDGAVFGDAGSAGFPAGFTMTSRYPGPINAFGDVIPQTLYDGTTEAAAAVGGGDPTDVPMRGWTQLVKVEKVDPYNINLALPRNTQSKTGAVVLRAVDRYPLRVSVTILFQSDPLAAAVPVTTVSWVVPP